VFLCGSVYAPADIATSVTQAGAVASKVCQVLAELGRTIEAVDIPISLETQPSFPKLHERVLVVGGGLAGLHASLALAKKGVRVVLVESESSLGGRFALPNSGLPQVSSNAESLRRRVLASELIETHLNAKVAASTRNLEGWNTVIKLQSGFSRVIKHGATILATGGKEAPPRSYCSHPRIITQTGFEQRLESSEFDIPNTIVKTIVMIQCVDSREHNNVTHSRPYCSRVCCQRAIRNAMRFLDAHSNAKVIILYRDMMTPGMQEQEYTRARTRGVVFIPFDTSDKPTIEIVDNKPIVRIFDQILGRTAAIPTDWVILSTGIEPSNSNTELAQLFGVGLDNNGFFEQADPKWQPVDLAVDGVYASGLASSPQTTSESIIQSEAAAHRAYARLRKKHNLSNAPSAEVRNSICSHCEACVQACVYHARWLDHSENKIVIDPRSCRMCGACATACPNAAARLFAFGESQIVAELDCVLEGIVQLRSK